jgi:hypothetical protein
MASGYAGEGGAESRTFTAVLRRRCAVGWPLCVVCAPGVMIHSCALIGVAARAVAGNGRAPDGQVCCAYFVVGWSEK